MLSTHRAINNSLLIDISEKRTYCSYERWKYLLQRRGIYKINNGVGYKTVLEWELFGDPSLAVGAESTLPLKPSKPNGPAQGGISKEITYSASTIDPDGDQIYYKFDWDDGTDSGWLGPKNSGEACKASHKWTSQGSFKVKVKAKDTEEHVSVWSESLTVSISKSRITRSYLTRFLENLIEKFPRIARLLECPFFEKLLNLQRSACFAFIYF